MLKRITSLALAAVAACTLALPATAQTWPTGPVRIVVPFPPGGTTDMIARLLAIRLGKTFDKAFIVDNKPGANTQIGTDAVAKAAPDGQTLLLTTSPFAIIAAMYPKLPYVPQRDLLPVIRIGENGMLLVANPNAPARTVPEIIAQSKAKPGALTVASVGNTGMSYMSEELFAGAAGIQLTNVPYKGTGQAMPDLLSGQVSYFFDNPSTSMPYVQSGKLLALAYTGSKRSPALPNVPTLAEAGLRDVETVNWYGIFAPAGTSPEIVTRLNREVNNILRQPDVAERLAKDSVDVVAGTPAEFASFLKSDFTKWATVVKQRNLHPE